jgi:glycerophosphoryl diester phosphodiesterase
VTLDQVRVIAHRGNSRALPENTMAAFRSAMMLGAHMIELDVRLSKDGVPVVVHDSKLLDGSLVAETRADQFYKYAAPELEEVLRLPIPLNLEIKAPEAIPAVVDLIGDRADVVISSFHLDALDFLRQLDARRPIAYLSREEDWQAVLQRAVAAGAFAINPPRKALTEGLVAQAHAAGLRVMSYTVNDRDEARMLFGWGVDAICTDDPATMLAIL